MRLYYAPGTISVAVAIALHEAGIAFESTRLSFADADQTKPEYLAINSKGRVPSLETHGQILTETGALLEYIAQIAPEAGLVPADALAAAHMRSVMYYMASTMHVNHAHKMRGSRWADAEESHAEMTAKVPQTMTASARYVEEECLLGRFVLDAAFSLADPYTFVVCNWLEGDGVDVSAFPRLSAFLDTMRARPSVGKVIAAGMLPA